MARWDTDTGVLLALGPEIDKQHTKRRRGVEYLHAASVCRDDGYLSGELRDEAIEARVAHSGKGAGEDTGDLSYDLNRDHVVRL